MAIIVSSAVATALAVFTYFGVIIPEGNRLNNSEDNKARYIMPLLAGLLIRLVLATVTDGYQIDMNCFKGWSERIAQVGFANFYSDDLFCDYSPGYLYILWLIGIIKNAFPFFIGAAENLLIKTPAIVCDVLTTVFIYKIAKKQFGSRVSSAVSFLYILSPVIIVNSAVWGQVDSVFTLFATLSLYLLAEEKYIKSSVLIGVAVLIKPQALMLGPIFVFVFLEKVIQDKKYIKTFFASVLAVSLTFFAGALPFLIKKGIWFIFELYNGTMSSYPYATLNAANLLGMTGANFAEQTGKFFIFSYEVCGAIAIICSVWICGVIFALSKDKSKIFYCSALLLMLVFTFGVRMHERYLFPAIILFLVSYILKKDKRIFAVATALSVLHFINVAYTYSFSLKDVYHIPGTDIIFIILSALMVITALAAILVGFKVFTNLKFKKGTLLKDNGKKLNKKDAIIILLITAVYAAVAFVNLGDIKAPYIKHEFKEEASAVFDKEHFIKKVSYYKGIGDTKISILTSTDGTEWQNNTFESGDCFKWEQREILKSAKYINVFIENKDTELFEMAFYDENENIIPVISESSLFDEQANASAFATYKNGTYFDEIYHARTAYEHIKYIGSHYENTHPPLGKHIIGIGIRIFGMNPFGWRFMGTIFGVMMLPLIYIFAKRMFKNTLMASSAILLMTFDFMHFSQTRIATIDSFPVFFIILMYFFMYIFYEEAETISIKKSLAVLLLSGVSMGLGIASKWIGAYAGAGLAVLFAVSMVRMYKSNREEFAKKFFIISAWCVLVFIVIPFGIYYASYIPIHIADGAKNWFENFINYQKHMLSYHSTLVAEHYFSSRWYEWPIMVRPIWYYSGTGLPDGTVSCISSFGNPVVWWGGTAACLYLIINKVGERDKRVSFILISLAAQYLPWIFIGRVVFIYHFFASVPFLILATVYMFKDICEKYKSGRKLIFLWLLTALVLFAAFYPVLSGAEISREYANMLEWFNTWVFCN